ncbi:hypothetical protein GGH91_006669, partial [Coemansia sp. RSA 2671]
PGADSRGAEGRACVGQRTLADSVDCPGARRTADHPRSRRAPPELSHVARPDADAAWAGTAGFAGRDASPSPAAAAHDAAWDGAAHGHDAAAAAPPPPDGIPPRHDVRHDASSSASAGHVWRHAASERPHGPDQRHARTQQRAPAPAPADDADEDDDVRHASPGHDVQADGLGAAANGAASHGPALCRRPRSHVLCGNAVLWHAHCSVQPGRRRHGQRRTPVSQPGVPAPAPAAVPAAAV